MLKIASSIILGFTTICTTAVLSHTPALAGQPNERIALMLTGHHCHDAQQSLEVAMRQAEGVVAVYSDTIPGHLLIDIEDDKTSSAALRTAAQHSIAPPLSCQVEVMQSCITAPKLRRVNEHAR